MGGHSRAPVALGGARCSVGSQLRLAVGGWPFTFPRWWVDVASLGASWKLLDASWVDLRGSRRHLVSSWRHPGGYRRHLGGSRRHLGAWKHLETSQEGLQKGPFGLLGLFGALRTVFISTVFKKQSVAAAMQVLNYTMQHAGEVICSMPPCGLEASPCAACRPNMESCNHPAFHCAAFPALN